MTDHKIVPCGSCHDCCKHGELIEVTEEHDGEFILQHEDQLQAVRVVGDDQVRVVLKHKPNGDCVFLGDEGCTIHGSQPYVCRQFDCRLHYLNWMQQPRHERRRQEKLIPGKKEAMANAKRKLEQHPL